MNEMYEKSIQMIKKLKKLPSRKEWNKIAKEKCLMSYTTLECWNNESFQYIWKSAKEAE